MSVFLKQCFALRNLLPLIGLSIILVLLISCISDALYPVNSCGSHQDANTINHNLIWEWSNPSTAKCDHAIKDMTIVREFFAISDVPSRSEETMNSIVATILNNPCSTFAFVVEQPEFQWALHGLTQHGPQKILIYYFGNTPVTYDRFFSIAMLNPNKNAVFAISTGDVVLPSLSVIVQSCKFQDANNNPNVFVVSRRDIPGAEDEQTCTWYQKMGSWDVFIGKASLLTDQVIHSTVFSPRYWGVENVVASVLTKGMPTQLVNLCPYVDVVHLHASRQHSERRLARVRISDDPNSIAHATGDAGAACRLDSLMTLLNQNASIRLK
ncbi:hypothetical protein BC830DRAFT_1096136 [Chytriomyces sp. MP71]|nr:hypothetical protein BC830DRAFT_1096136 [Chytriomyces sp. MP71]